MEMAFKFKFVDVFVFMRQEAVTNFNMLPSYRTMKYKSPMWGYFHV